MFTPLPPKYWANLRREQVKVPGWEYLAECAIWQSNTYRELRRTLSGSITSATPAGDRAGGDLRSVQVVELTQGEEVIKDFAWGRLVDLLTYKTPSLYVIELDPEEELPEPLLMSLDAQGDVDTASPFIIFTDDRVKEKLLHALEEVGRVDVVTIWLAYNWSKEVDSRPSFAVADAGFRAPRRVALVGGELRGERLYPWILDLDSKQKSYYALAFLVNRLRITTVERPPATSTCTP